MGRLPKSTHFLRVRIEVHILSSRLQELRSTGDASRLTNAPASVSRDFVAVIEAGYYVPPALIFPRKRYKPEFCDRTPPDTLGMVSDSGFINSELFMTWLEHFSKHVVPSQQKKKLLILDNHISHCSLAAIEYCREKGIILLSLPPHASHKFQPLDVSFFGPLKKSLSEECDRWVTNHPGRPITIYQVEVNLENEAGPSSVGQNNEESPLQTANNLGEGKNHPSGSNVSPKDLLPSPKGRREKKRGNRSKSSAIMTSSPFKKSLEDCATVSKRPKRKAAKKLSFPTEDENDEMEDIDDDDDDDPACIYCNSLYSGSKYRENWIQCQKCRLWAHTECAGINRRAKTYSLKLAGSEFQSLGRAIVKEDEYEEVRWDGIVSIWLKEGKLVINKISQLGPMDPLTNSRCGPPDILGCCQLDGNSVKTEIPSKLTEFQRNGREKNGFDG
ncbi:hypothetical protein ANN_12256 [Periplaneta americana]|uniref:DDE-1 domain-containing protein n=1 Tax=Periplaneta americana TaxID=6978 RepID=A0ABQ8TIR4_PERAM|nr:hypothetical protein ANN_12256 [Periplaneta americana]